MARAVFIIIFSLLSHCIIAGGDAGWQKNRDTYDKNKQFKAQMYLAPKKDSPWQFSGNRLLCQLKLNIENYGAVDFSKAAGKGAAFRLSSIFLESSEPDAKVWLMPPNWRTDLGPQLLDESFIRNQRINLQLPDIITEKMLLGLYSGYSAKVNYHSELGLNISVVILPIDFQDIYLKYTRCVKKVLPYSFDDIANTTLLFSVDDYSLSAEDRRRLDNIKTYVEVDPDVTEVYVAGYSDNVGRRGVNNAVSERRAKVVGNYLLQNGIPQDKLRINWYGQRRPVATNLTEEGRIKNRRVEIKIFRKRF